MVVKIGTGDAGEFAHGSLPIAVDRGRSDCPNRSNQPAKSADFAPPCGITAAASLKNFSDSWTVREENVFLGARINEGRV